MQSNSFRIGYLLFTLFTIIIDITYAIKQCKAMFVYNNMLCYYVQHYLVLFTAHISNLLFVTGQASYLQQTMKQITYT